MTCGVETLFSQLSVGFQHVTQDLRGSSPSRLVCKYIVWQLKTKQNERSVWSEWNSGV